MCLCIAGGQATFHLTRSSDVQTGDGKFPIDFLQTFSSYLISSMLIESNTGYL
jgi:hypothetical protein